MKKNNSLEDVTLIQLPKIQDVRGNLSVVEKDTLPFSIKRVYFLYDVPSDSSRGGHAHKKLQQLLIATSGSFKVILKDREGNTKEIVLNKPYQGLYIPTHIWRELDDFSSGAVCLVIASEEFDIEDYIYDFQKFLNQ